MKLPTQAEDNELLLLTFLSMVGIDPGEMSSQGIQLHRTKTGCTLTWDKVAESSIAGSPLRRTRMVTTFAVETSET